eukprot:CFRG2853T1
MSEPERKKRKQGLDGGPKRRVMKVREGVEPQQKEQKKRKLTTFQKRELSKKRRIPKFTEAAEEEEDDIIAAQQLLEGGFSENEMDDSGASSSDGGSSADENEEEDDHVEVVSLKEVFGEKKGIHTPVSTKNSNEPIEDKDVEPKLAPVPGAGLANVMSKILNPELGDDTDGPILAKDNQVKRKIEESTKLDKDRKMTAQERKERKEIGHVSAGQSTKIHERALSKIATRGLVKLFNTIRKQQKELDEQLESVNEGKKKKVLNNTLDKAKFIDMLKTKTIGKEAELKSRLDGTDDSGMMETAGQNWLKNDYMMTHKMKDFDKEADDDELVDDGGHIEEDSEAEA